MKHYSKVLTEKEFKARCKAKNIKFTIRLWNRYMEREWYVIEKELHKIPLDKQL